MQIKFKVIQTSTVINYAESEDELSQILKLQKANSIFISSPKKEDLGFVIN